MSDDPVLEAARLLREIREHDRRYHGDDSPIVSDAEYDELCARYDALRRKRPDEIPPRPIGFKATSKRRPKALHASPMLSLDNARSDKELVDFLERSARSLSLSKDAPLITLGEAKIDGASIALRYEKGRLTRAAVRGDGAEGEDVTDNALRIDDIPSTLRSSRDHPFPSLLEVRGEVYITRGDFFEVNRKRVEAGEEAFANPRNSAAGSLRQIHLASATRLLRFVAHGSHLEIPSATSHSETAEIFASWGLPIVSERRLCRSREEMFDFHLSLEKKRSELDFDIDGVVFKVDDLGLCARLGSTARGPRWAIARKFSPDQAVTTLRAIDVQVGRTGVLTPVARLDPVTVGGVVVSNATLHNEDEIVRKGVCVGDSVIVQRAGDVIPQIVGVAESGGGDAFVFPTTCPACGAEAIRFDGDVARRCSKPWTCSAQREERLLHFASRAALDIDGFGDAVARALLERGLIAFPADVFSLRLRDSALSEDDPNKLKNWEGWGEASAWSLFSAIESRRSPPLDRFVYALGIPLIGTEASRLLARYFKDVDGMLRGLEAANAARPSPWFAMRDGEESTRGVGRIFLDRMLSAVERMRDDGSLESFVLASEGDVSRELKAVSLLLGSGKSMVAAHEALRRMGSLRALVDALSDSVDFVALDGEAETLGLSKSCRLGMRSAVRRMEKEGSLESFLTSCESDSASSWRAFYRLVTSGGGDRKSATALLTRHGSLRSLVAALKEAEGDRKFSPWVRLVEDLDPSEDMRAAATSVCDYFADSRSRRVVEDLLKEVSPLPFEVASTSSSPLAGKRVVFTGEMRSMPRHEAKAVAERLGAKTLSSVSKSVDLVVSGEGAGRKRTQAEALGVSVIDEASWLRLIAGDADDVAPTSQRTLV